jgi:uncharacterized protein YbaR (Trm112 family)/SAM-dependent methyltransferase
VKLSLLDLLVCPGCGGDLAALAFRTRKSRSQFGHFCDRWCAARNVRPGETPVPSKACLRCGRREIVEGVLWCEPCRRAFPVHATIPEVLPPDLENPDVMDDVLKGRPDGGWTAPALVRKLLSFRRRWFGLTHRPTVRRARAGAARVRSGAAADGGTEESRYKRAEVRLTRRKDLSAGFFTPGLSEPFVRLQPSHSIEKILRFMIPVKQADLRFGDTVLDLGVGYAWTTEWLMKLGYNAVGVDLNRDYLRVGMRRAKGRLPQLVIADAENLPFRKEMFHGAFFFDAFHHLAGRAAALSGCADALVAGGALLMAEPGEKHETQPSAVHIMRTYGILEKGITEDEFRRWAWAAGFVETKKFPFEFGEVELLMAVKPGKRIFTSRGPNYLFASVTPGRTELEMKAGRKAEIPFTVRNEGDTVWLSRTPDGIGRVRIGFQLQSADGALLNEHYLRVPLPRDLAPGEEIELVAKLPAIRKPGDYLFEVDGVAEGILWFKDVRYHPVTINVNVVR